MEKLPETIKRRIIEHLAAYRTPGKVAELIEMEFGVRLTPRHVRAYDPTSLQFAAGRRSKEYFETARDRFDRDVAAIPIYYRAYRLHKLEELRKMAMAQGNVRLAMKALKQAAQEVGDIYTNRSTRADMINLLAPKPRKDVAGESHRSREELLAEIVERARRAARA